MLLRFRVTGSPTRVLVKNGGCVVVATTTGISIAQCPGAMELFLMLMTGASDSDLCSRTRSTRDLRWPDLVTDMQEILRVLKPGGKLVIIGEAYKRRRLDPTQVAMKLLRAAYLTVSEHRELFSQAGYSEGEIFEERRKGWICAKGSKPSITDSQNHGHV